MQDKILLGLLFEKEKLTSYEIKKIMENSTSLFYTTSLGSINPAFQKLEKTGAVKSNEKIENNRFKKYYSITEKGKSIFLEWMKEDIEISKLKENSLLKLFFFSHIPLEDRKIKIKNYLEKIKSHLEKLDMVETTCGVDNKYQLDVLNLGQDYYKFLYKWFENYLNGMKTIKETGESTRDFHPSLS